tara:strand:+ start:390 stop:524 length:135 start_codon:yes stop_codon:yes gene_type:complete
MLFEEFTPHGNIYHGNVWLMEKAKLYVGKENPTGEPSLINMLQK